VKHKIDEAVRTLFPGYFAYVMATGIVAAGLNGFGYVVPAKVLFWLAAIGYIKLWVLTIYRLVRHPASLMADFTSFGKGPGFFTIVAGTGVLAAVANRLYHASDFAFWLFCFAAVLWVILNYSFATVVIVSAEKPTAERGVNGAWLVIVVATQSLSILAALLSDRVPLFLSAGLFMMGGATYLLLISLIVSRLILTKVEAADMAPPYWIMMGGAAISCLAGAELNKHSGAWGFNVNAFPVLQAFTLFFWMVATAWIPLLIILGIWRHGVKRVPLTYEPMQWSMVFPLGMYTFATLSAAEQFKLPFIEPISAVFLPIACLAWLLVFFGMVWDGVQLLTRDETALAVTAVRP
jgi:tellurite resistance protein TehA-like permease